MKPYYPTINLLRGIAALFVCLFHFIGYEDVRGALFPPDSFIAQLGALGVNGVFIFFVISGFVIPLSLSKDHFNIKQLPRFFSRRFIRIEIPYLVSILLILLVGILFSIKNNSDYSFHIEQLIYHIIYFIPFSGYEWYNVIYWTLAIEFQFYIIIGLLYFFLASGNTLVMHFSLLMFGLSGFLVDDNRFIFHYAPIFLSGITLFLYKSQKMNAVSGILFIGFSLMTTAYLHAVEISLFTALTLLAIHTIEVDHKLSNRFGEISYSLYLTHGLIGGNLLYFLSRYSSNNLVNIILVIAAIITSLAFSYLFWKYIENPSRKLSKKVSLE